jgi:hypothetical protein
MELDDTKNVYTAQSNVACSAQGSECPRKSKKEKSRPDSIPNPIVPPTNLGRIYPTSPRRKKENSPG